jgi:cytochrome c biogenesis protein CcdA
MHTIALIGFLGGLITGISPCILPVLPVVFFSGSNSTPPSTRDSSPAARPYLVIAGLVCSFSVVTLTGSALLSALHLPQDAIRWAALVTLTLIGGSSRRSAPARTTVCPHPATSNPKRQKWF